MNRNWKFNLGSLIACLLLGITIASKSWIIGGVGVTIFTLLVADLSFKYRRIKLAKRPKN